MKKLISTIVPLLVLSLFAACSGGDSERIVVASQTRPCHGVGLMECMLVKHQGDTEWSFFYGNIEGFDYEPGFEYVLKVRKSVVENPPMDASSIKYSLERVISKTAKESENLP